jgi:hypothetical protein
VPLGEVDAPSPGARDPHERVGERLLGEIAKARLGRAERHDDPRARLGDLVAAHPLRGAVRVDELVAEARVLLRVAAQQLLGRGEGGVVGAVEGEDGDLARERGERAERVRGERVDPLPGDVEDDRPPAGEPGEDAEGGGEEQPGEDGDGDEVGAAPAQRPGEPVAAGEEGAGDDRGGADGELPGEEPGVPEEERDDRAREQDEPGREQDPGDERPVHVPPQRRPSTARSATKSESTQRETK